MEYPEIIYATEKVGSNGIHCFDYRNYDEDVKYIRYDKVKHLLERSDNSEYKTLKRHIFAGRYVKLRQRRKQ